jgi:hypothetical protein
VSARFDLAARGFPFEQDGALATAHPVDQAVHLALGVARGSIASAPGFGLGLDRSAALHERDRDARVRMAVERALAHLIARGDIALRSVATSAPPPAGRLVVVVEYVNLRLPQNPPRRLRV